MPFQLDDEVGAALTAMAAGAEPAPLPPVGDVASRRQSVETLQRAIHGQLPTPSDVTITDHETTAEDGTPLLLRWYAKTGSNPGSAVLYIHGGGMILSNVEIYDGPVARYVSATGVPFLSVEYRYAPEFPTPIPVTDCYAGLTWLAEQAPALGVDATRIAIMGDSGGGGVAASLAVYVRDHGGPAIARQILIYPMLDDRNTTPDPELVPFLTWTYDDNATGWGALLGDACGGPGVTPYGAAARLDDFTGLSPTYLEVGELDIFRDETIAYARGLLSAGVSTELHVHPSVPHAFEALVPSASISRRSAVDRHRAILAV